MDNVSKAADLFGRGFMCSQAIFAAFSEQFGITEKQALQIGACFGGGMSKAKVCGACTVFGYKTSGRCFTFNETSSAISLPVNSFIFQL
ncbi:MAG: C_GCAxxG_C_C family protein [Ruminococcus sp.]|nr:C_GCAxxG_C_C family protein [Ruminococcus sp.]